MECKRCGAPLLTRGRNGNVRYCQSGECMQERKRAWWRQCKRKQKGRYLQWQRDYWQRRGKRLRKVREEADPELRVRAKIVRCAREEANEKGLSVREVLVSQGVEVGRAGMWKVTKRSASHDRAEAPAGR
jgi:hypothetical protein